jgi:hypothetical protein
MRLALDHVFASAVRSSIAAAMVIAEPVLYENCLQFSIWRDLRREKSTKGNSNPAAAEQAGL